MDLGRWLRMLALRWRSLFRRREVERELDDELRYHVERQVAEYVAGGMDPAAARTAALQAFGGIEFQKEQVRDTRGLRWLEDLAADLRYAQRTLRRTPSFALVVIATLALGIGSSTAVFSVVDGVLLRPLPYPRSDRLVQFWEVNPRGHHMQVADANFRDLVTRAHSFRALAEFGDYGVVPVSGGTVPVRAHAAIVSKDFFPVLGVAPLRGRLFVDAEQQEGGRPAAIVSTGFWQRAFGGSPDVLGATLHIGGEPYVVVGVMPATVNVPVGAEVWVPRERLPRYPSRSAHNWRVVGRLRDGVTFEQATRDASAIMKSLRQRYGDDVTAVDGTLVPLREQLVGSTRPTLLVLLGASLVLLLIACTNAVNLLIARTASRHGEIAVRTALGAGRGRLIRQFLVECLVLALAGSAVGVVLARLGVAWMLALQTGRLPRAGDVSVDWRVLAFALAVSIGVGALMALWVAWWATRRDLREALSEGQRSVFGGGASSRVRRGLVVAQFAMTLVMLVAAGVLARSFQRLLSVEPGFSTTRAVVLDLGAPGGDDSTALRRRVQLYDGIAAQLAAIPGVSDVGAVNTMPLAVEGVSDGAFLIVTGIPGPFDLSRYETLARNPERIGQAEFRVAGPGYFAAMRIPLRRGRTFEARDTYDAPHVAVISQSLADEKWPDRDPIGQQIEFGNMDGDARIFTVVGVVGDVREADLAAKPRPTFYADYRQRPVKAGSMNFIIATSGGATPVIVAARRIARQLAPESPPRIRTIERIVSTSLADRRFVLVLVGAFGSAALLLATLGIYGVMAYLVTERRREIGVRLALGSTGAGIVRLVVGQGARMAWLGIGIGIAIALGGMRTLAGFLYGVSPLDPVAFLAVAALLATVGAVASWASARRAAAVSPVEVLRG
jgi:putative ABC transport system permease protein